MPTKRPILAIDEYYHIFNRGVDKRNIFASSKDVDRFICSMQEFNRQEPVESVREALRPSHKTSVSKSVFSLVTVVAFCLNPNHYHLLLRQEYDSGISEFMKRLNGGYTTYFNLKYGRSGSLFESRFKASHIDSNEYLLHLSAYINLNFEAHQFSAKQKHLHASSFDSLDEKADWIDTSIYLDQVNSNSQYRKFARTTLERTLKKKEEDKELKAMLME